MGSRSVTIRFRAGGELYLFLASIGFSLFYFVFYAFGPGTGDSRAPTTSRRPPFFEMQAKQFEGVEVTEALIYRQSMNADLVKGMKKRNFQSKCSTCHGARRARATPART